MLAAPTITESALATVVFAKTDKGRTEVAQRGASLSSKQRSVLIMLDGRKPAQSLTSLVPAAQLAQILDELAAVGMIVPVAAALAAAPAATPPMPVPVAAAPVLPPAIPPAPPADPSRLSPAKAILIRSAESCLGPIAADLIRQIAAAADEHQLQRAIGHWHMAMRDSKFGRDVADTHLQQVKASLLVPA